MRTSLAWRIASAYLVLILAVLLGLALYVIWFTRATYLQQLEAQLAADGQQALELAEQAQPDAVILDVMLPKLNGFDVCRALRRASTAPILLLTAVDVHVRWRREKVEADPSRPVLIETVRGVGYRFRS